jgi:hypothetical protein
VSSTGPTSTTSGSRDESVATDAAATGRQRNPYFRPAKSGRMDRQQIVALILAVLMVGSSAVYAISFAI